MKLSKLLNLPENPEEITTMDKVKVTLTSTIIAAVIWTLTYCGFMLLFKGILKVYNNFKEKNTKKDEEVNNIDC